MIKPGSIYESETCKGAVSISYFVDKGEKVLCNFNDGDIGSIHQKWFLRKEGNEYKIVHYNDNAIIMGNGGFTHERTLKDVGFKEKKKAYEKIIDLILDGKDDPNNDWINYEKLRKGLEKSLLN
jgi:hypothetical protein